MMVKMDDGRVFDFRASGRVQVMYEVYRLVAGEPYSAEEHETEYDAVKTGKEMQSALNRQYINNPYTVYVRGPFLPETPVRELHLPE